MRTSRPSVAAVVPVYNHVSFVRDAIRSLADQTVRPDQLVLIDDASTDGSFERARAEVEAHSWVTTLIRHETNRGLCRTLNEALGHVHADLVLILASDDTLPREKIQRQLSFLLSNTCYGAVLADMSVMDQAGQFLRVDRGFDRSVGVRQRPGHGEVRFVDVALGRSSPSIQSGLFWHWVLKDLGGFDESLRFEDLDLLLRLLSRFRVAYLFEPGANYRVVPTGLSHRFREFEDDFEKILLKHQARLFELGVPWRSVDASNAVRRAEARLNTDDRLGALTWSRRAVGAQPKNLAAWSALVRSTMPVPLRAALRAARRRLRGSG